MRKCWISLRILQMSILFLSGVLVAGECFAETPVSDAIVLGISVPKETFIQAEPVPMRTEIRNRSDKPVEVISNLEPEYLILRFRLTDPEWETWIFGSLGAASIERLERMSLNPGDKRVYTAVLLYGVVGGGERFLFTNTGKYTVEAFYDAQQGGKPISSEPVTVTAVEVDNVDSQAQKLFLGQEQGRLAYFGHSVDQAAVDKFQRVLQKYRTSRFAPYAAYSLGLHYLNERERERGIALLERVLADHKDFPLNAELRYRLAIAY